MRFEEIKGTYDTIVSLGSSCELAAHLHRKGLRMFSSPLDWVVSLSVTEVNRQVKSYFIKEFYYNVISIDEFPVLEGNDCSYVYPGFKDKTEMHSKRLLDQLNVSRKALFIRWGSTLEEAVQLRAVLGTLTGGVFHILIINAVDGLETVVDNDWELPGITSLSIPNRAGDNEIWDDILAGISLE